MNVQMGAKLAFPQEMCLSFYLRTDLTCISIDENYFPLLSVSYNLALVEAYNLVEKLLWNQEQMTDWESIF